MNEETINRIRLEERARSLAKASQDLNLMLKELDLKKSNKKPNAEAEKVKESNKKKKNARSSQSLNDLNAGAKGSGIQNNGKGRGTTCPTKAKGRGTVNQAQAQKSPGRGKQNFHMQRGAHNSQRPVLHSSPPQFPMFPPPYDAAAGFNHPAPRPPFVNPYLGQNVKTGSGSFGVGGPHFVPSQVPPLTGPPTKSPQQTLNVVKKASIPHNSPNPPPLIPMKATPSNDNKVSALSPKDIAMELGNFRGFRSTLERLNIGLRQQQKKVLSVVNENLNIFTIMTLPDEVTIELCPKINICLEYTEPNGCQKQQCLGLHICQHFFIGQCMVDNCMFGHVWKSNHNNRIFKTFQIENLSDQVLHELMQNVLKGKVIPKICLDYNQNLCNKGTNCNNLHLCNQYVISLGNCPEGSLCHYNHVVHDPICRAVFEKYGVSINESPRDILKKLADNIKNLSKDSASSQLNTEREDENSSTDDSDEQNEEEQIGKDGNKNEPSTIKPQKPKKIRKSKAKTKTNVPEDSKSKLFFAWQINGEVEIPSICMFGVNDNCEKFDKDCKYLHAKSTFHWQFGTNKKWFNFHVFHSKFLEEKFRDVNCDEVILPNLDPKLVKESMKSLLCLLGTKPIKINFNLMTLDCGGSHVKYDIRQLTTPSSAIYNNEKSTNFKWYFLNGKDWMMYDSSNACPVSSKEIEKAYLISPLVPFTFISQSLVYELNFISMTQRNVTTTQEIPIKRRPEPFASSQASSTASSQASSTLEKIKLPNHWDKMDYDKESSRLVKLSSSSDEFRDIRQIIHLSLPICTIVTILRVQNETLWRLFKCKEEELELKYKDNFVNTQKLFHGINSQHLQDICQNNLDWRFHDANTSKNYGQGAYFFNSAAIGSNLCTVNSMGNKLLLVANVIIGQIAQGDASMTRPPENHLMSALFDTTVDDIQSPSVFVKYDKHEYYPAYIVEFK